MKKLLILMFLMPSVAYPQVSEDGGFRTVLKGTVAGADGRELYVMISQNLDREINKNSIIPIVDGKFEYVLEGDYLQCYELVFLEEFLSGSFSYLDFFPDAEVVEFKISNIDFMYYNTVSGGEINRAMSEFKAEMEKLFGEREDALTLQSDYLEENDLYYSAEAKSIYKQIDEINERVCDAEAIRSLYGSLNELKEEGKDKTPEATLISKKIDALYKEMKKWQYEYATAHPSLYAYSILLNDISSYRYHSVKPDLADMERAYAALSAANPGHPYNKIAAEGFNALRTLVPGAMFTDFTAPTLDGTTHTLSEEIRGKIAVIDLWASWCGSCRRESLRIIPVYEKYKDRGFTVVGVAREFKNTDDLVIALRRDAYPWLNLVEIDDRAGIWMKYGANNAGGRKILVDENGRIVKLDVTAEEIGEYLSSRLD